MTEIVVVSHKRAAAGSFRYMAIARITVTSVADHGDTVIVYGRSDIAKPDTAPTGFVFQTKGEHGGIALAERASRLAGGTMAIIDYSVISSGWNSARALIVL